MLSQKGERERTNRICIRNVVCIIYDTLLAAKFTFNPFFPFQLCRSRHVIPSNIWSKTYNTVSALLCHLSQSHENRERGPVPLRD